MDIQVLKKYRSKRNNVYKIRVKNLIEEEIAIMQTQDNHEGLKKDNVFIMKKYDSKNKYLRGVEYKNIKTLEDLSMPVPKIIYKTRDSLILEYIQGELLVDLVEKQFLGDWIDEFALWMVELHKIKNKSSSLLKMDVNLRNFIYDGDKVYGLDFESLGYGDPRTDLANICFFILTDRPSFTREKHLIMRHFLKSYERHSGEKLKDMGYFLLQSKKDAKIRRKKV